MSTEHTIERSQPDLITEHVSTRPIGAAAVNPQPTDKGHTTIPSTKDKRDDPNRARSIGKPQPRTKGAPKRACVRDRDRDRASRTRTLQRVTTGLVQRGRERTNTKDAETKSILRLPGVN